MTEPHVRDFVVALETARDADARRAGDLAELAGLVEGVRDGLAEIMLSVQAKALGLDRALAGMRLVLDEIRERAQRYGLECAAACESLTRRIGPPRASPADDGSNDDTRPIDMAEVAAMNAEDAKDP